MKATMDRKGTITLLPETDAEMVICALNAATAAIAKESK